MLGGLFSYLMDFLIPKHATCGDILLHWHVKMELGQNVFVYCSYSLELYTEWEQGVLPCSLNKTKKLLME